MDDPHCETCDSDDHDTEDCPYSPEEVKRLDELERRFDARKRDADRLRGDE